VGVAYDPLSSGKKIRRQALHVVDKAKTSFRSKPPLDGT
jgi:hypothetical protein